MPHGEPHDEYTTGVYNTLKDKAGLTLSRDEFVAAMAKPEYRQGVYGVLQDQAGLTLPEDQFYSAMGFGEPVKKKEGTPSEPGVQPSTPGLGPSQIPSPQVPIGSVEQSIAQAQSQLRARGVPLGPPSRAARGISGEAAMGTEIPVSEIFEQQRSPFEPQIETFGQTPEPYVPMQESKAQFIQEEIAGLEAARENELAQIPVEAKAERERITRRFEGLIGEQKLKLEEDAETQRKMKETAFDPPAKKTTKEAVPDVLELPKDETLQRVGFIPEEANLTRDVKLFDKMMEHDDKMMESFSTLANKDIDEWAKGYGDELTQEDVEAIKAFQTFTQETLAQEDVLRFDKVQSIKKEYRRLQARMEESQQEKELKRVADVRGISVNDLIYESKKDASVLIDNLPSDMQEHVRAEWEVTSDLRDFLSQYYDPTGKKGFTIDQFGRVDVSGITDPKELDYINNKVNTYLKGQEKLRNDMYASMQDDIWPQRLMMNKAYNSITAAEEKLAGLPEDDPRRKDLQAAIDKARLGYDQLFEEVQKKEASRENIFITDPQKVVSNISNEISESNSAQAAFSSTVPGLTPYERFERGYMRLMEDTEQMRRSGGFDASYLDQVGQNMRSWLDWESLGVALSKEEKEYLANRRILNSLSPVFFNNSLGITEQSGDFFEAFMSGVGSFVNPETTGRLTQTQVVADQLQGISEMGFASDDFNKEDVVEDMQSRVKDVPWYSQESAGQITGVVGAVMGDLILSNALVVNPALSLAKKGKYLKRLADTYDKVMDASKLGKFMKNPADAALRYEVAGNVFGSAEEELNAASGLLGVMGGDGVKALFKGMPTDKLGAWFTSTFGSRTNEAVKTLADLNARGAGELGEEFTQELVQIYNDELRDRGFWEEVGARFGDYNENMKFIVSSYLMGAGFSFVGPKQTEEFYKELTPEQKEQVNSVVNEVKDDLAKATAAVVDESKKGERAEDAVEQTKTPEAAREPISKAVVEMTPEADTEYKVDDKFYSEAEMSKMLDNPEFVAQVENEEVKLEVKNPSEAIQEKITPTVEVEPEVTPEAEPIVETPVAEPVVETPAVEVTPEVTPEPAPVVEEKVTPAPTTTGEARVQGMEDRGKISNYDRKFMRDAEPASPTQAIKIALLSGDKLKKDVLAKETGFGTEQAQQKGVRAQEELTGRKGFYSLKEGEGMAIDEFAEKIKGTYPTVFEGMDDTDIRNELLDVIQIRQLRTERKPQCTLIIWLRKVET
jgi:hypothetical protein